MGTLAIVIGIYLAVTTLVTCLLFLGDGAAVKEWPGTDCGEKYYELKNHSYGSPFWKDEGHIGDGCIKLMFLPLYWIFQSVSKLNYTIKNLTYYLPGGAEKRVAYIKNYLEKLSVKLREHEEFLGESDPEVWFKRGRQREWNLKEIMESDYEQFADDYLMKPRVFWFRTLKSFLILLFWPLTIIAGYGYLGFILLCMLWIIMAGNIK